MYLSSHRYIGTRYVPDSIDFDQCNVYLKFLYLRGRDFDKRQWESVHVYEQYNVPDSYRDKLELAH
jgi:hypothetical protein